MSTIIITTTTTTTKTTNYLLLLHPIPTTIYVVPKNIYLQPMIMSGIIYVYLVF